MSGQRHLSVSFQTLTNIVLILFLSNCAIVPSAPGLEKTQIRWFVGLEIGTTPEQITTLQEVVSEFNSSQNQIDLRLQVATAGGAYDALATQFATREGPDIIGPISWGIANTFPGQWLNLNSYIHESNFDLSQYDPALVDFYKNEEGIISLPFAVSPSAIYFVPARFDEAGLEPPPQVYGEKYLLDGQAVDWSWDTLAEVARRLTIDIYGFNATQPEFDREQIDQVGFSFEGQNALSIATFFGADQIYAGTTGNYVSSIHESWKRAWAWWYDAMRGTHPFMATGDLADTFEFGKGNVFDAGKSAMGLSQAWFTCCLTDFHPAGKEFQLAVLPMSDDGMVHGRITEQSFYVWNQSEHPQEAFQVLAYLVTTGADKILPVYNAMSAILDKADTFFTNKALEYPFVTRESWNVFIQGLAYTDIPSADQYLPHRSEALNRIQVFADLLAYSRNLDFEAEFQKLQDDLTMIYNK